MPLDKPAQTARPVRCPTTRQPVQPTNGEWQIAVIARLSGVSTSKVSRTRIGNARIHEAKPQRIIDLAASLNERVNASY